MLRYLAGACALAMALACASTPALAADNMTVKDAAGTVQTVCTKEDASLVDHPCHVMEGIYNGQPVKIAVDATGAVYVVMPSGAATSAAQATANASLASILSALQSPTLASGAATASNQVAAQTSLSALAASNPAYGGVTNMPTDGATYTAGRSVQLECTVAGNVKLTFADASVRTIPVQPGLSILPYVVTAWTLSGVSSPATCTYANLK